MICHHVKVKMSWSNICLQINSEHSQLIGEQHCKPLKPFATCLHFICISNRTISSIHTFDKELSFHYTVHFKQISFQFTIPWRDLAIYNQLVLEVILPSPFEFSCAYYIHVSIRHINIVFPPKFFFSSNFFRSASPLNKSSDINEKIIKELLKNNPYVDI